MQSLHLYTKLKWHFFVLPDSTTEKHQNINKYAKECKITIGSVCRAVHHKNLQISHTFSPKSSLEIGSVAYLQEHLVLRMLMPMPVFMSQSNAWLLSFECSAHVLVVMQKSMEKLCWMKKFLSTNTRKDESYVKVGRNNVLYIKVVELWVRLWSIFHCDVNSEFTFDEGDFSRLDFGYLFISFKRLLSQNLSC